MVFIWYFNGNYIGDGMEELRHQDLWAWAMILCFFSLGMIFLLISLALCFFMCIFAEKVKFLIL